MNSKTVLPGQLGLGNTESGFKTIESEAVAKVLREDWESKILENATNVGIINKHQNFVGMPPGLVAAYMSNITANTKHMTKCELQAYLKVLEALKVGYTARFPELANLLLLGVTTVSKDVRSTRRHLDDFIGSTLAKSKSYAPVIYRESRGVDRLKIRLTASERSLLRFLKKREITVIRRAIEKKHRRIIKLQGKKSFMECLVNNIDSMANPYPAKR